MDGFLYANVSLGERLLRTFIGCYIIIRVLAVPIEPGWFAAVNIFGLYLLTSALIAWDPGYHLLYRLLAKFHLPTAFQVHRV